MGIKKIIGDGAAWEKVRRESMRRKETIIGSSEYFQPQYTAQTQVTRSDLFQAMKRGSQREK